MVILEAPEWSPIRQVNFVASLDKMAADQTKKRYPEIEVPNERPFKCLSFARKSFVYFLDLDRVLYLHADRSRSYLFILSKAQFIHEFSTKGGDSAIPLPRGVYILRMDGETYKIRL